MAGELAPAASILPCPEPVSLGWYLASLSILVVPPAPALPRGRACRGQGLAPDTDGGVEAQLAGQKPDPKAGRGGKPSCFQKALVGRWGLATRAGTQPLSWQQQFLLSSRYWATSFKL